MLIKSIPSRFAGVFLIHDILYSVPSLSFVIVWWLPIFTFVLLGPGKTDGTEKISRNRACMRTLLRGVLLEGYSCYCCGCCCLRLLFLLVSAEFYVGISWS